MPGRVRCFLLVLALAAASAAQDLKIARLGDLPLTGGGVIRDCRVGYRTYGKLDAAKSNAVLYLAWYGGTSAQLADAIGPGRLLDTDRWFVVAIDALGNGVSSSPSNSPRQPRMAFPPITIADMVASQHALATRELGLSHVHAVVGISMGGMQTFQWMVDHPGFMDVAIPIAGSPRLAPYDLVLWRTYRLAITENPGWKGGDYKENPGLAARGAFWVFAPSTPGRVNRLNTREQVLDKLDRAKTAPLPDANDQIIQLDAMTGLDVSSRFKGSMAAAAATVKCRALVVAGTTDHVVSPGPALEFAKLAGAETLVFENDCGHGALGCEYERLTKAVAAALGR